jgi:hypothetical protein
MLTIEDCIALCDLTEEEEDAIEGHEDAPEAMEAEFGHYLVRTPSGQTRIKLAMRQDIAAARWRDDFRRSARLKLALKHFLSMYPAPHRLPYRRPVYIGA